MQTIIKRLKIVKLAIELDDEDIIAIQVWKLKKSNINNDILPKILLQLEKSKYFEVIDLIDNFIANFQNDNVTNLSEIEETLNALIAQKKELEETLNSINEDNPNYKELKTILFEIDLSISELKNIT